MPDAPRADLHMHTLCSDGSLSPAELVARAQSVGLSAISVTDHDCIDGLAEAKEAGALLGVEVVAGVELSVTVEDTEVHVLGYFFDPDHAALRAHLDAFQVYRRRRAEAMVARLHDLGVALPVEAVWAQAKGGALGRPHVAEALLAEGFVTTQQEAFERFIGDRAPAFVPKPLFPAAEALALLHEAGGIGVIAHPGHWTRDTTLMSLIRSGLDGVETIHPSHDASLTRYYREVARDFGLLETGGSDYHGPRPDSEDRLGIYTIPMAHLERARSTAATLTVT